MKAAKSIQIVSGDRPVRMDSYLHAGKEPQAAVLLLHGASGLGSGNQYIPHLAAALAEQGLGALVLRYFEATGTTYASDATIWKYFEQWLGTVRDAVDAAEKLPNVDPKKIALAGYSLGGFLAVAYASRDPRIRVVAEFAGGIDPSFEKEVQRLPPTFIAHGEVDRRVPVDRALRLQAALERLGSPHEVRIYPEEGHLLSGGAALDAFSGALAFLQKHLGSGAAEAG